MYQGSPTFTSAAQLAPGSSGSLCSSGSNSSSSAAPTSNPASNLSAAAADKLFNPYFNYSNGQFGSYPGAAAHAPAGAQLHHHHPYGAYNSAYCGSASGGQSLAEAEGYASSQFQYAGAGPQAWYSNPTDPRFTSKTRLNVWLDAHSFHGKLIWWKILLTNRIKE
jgi:hypothetical protein